MGLLFLAFIIIIIFIIRNLFNKKMDKIAKEERKEIIENAKELRLATQEEKKIYI